MDTAEGDIKPDNVSFGSRRATALVALALALMCAVAVPEPHQIRAQGFIPGTGSVPSDVSHLPEAFPLPLSTLDKLTESMEQDGLVRAFVRVVNDTIFEQKGMDVTVDREFSSLPQWKVITVRTPTALQALAQDPGIELFENPMIEVPDNGPLNVSGIVQSSEPNSSEKGIIVVNIGTGVDYEHPDLTNNLIRPGACFSTIRLSDPSGTTLRSTCPNGEETDTESQNAGDYCGSTEGCGHDTGVIYMIISTNPDVKVMSIQIASIGSDGKMYITGEAAMAALDYLLTLDDIDVLNMSWGFGAFSGTCDDEIPYLADVSRLLREKGIVVFAASGNTPSSEEILAPACIKDVEAVGSVTDDGKDKIPYNTSTSDKVVLVAPGVGLNLARTGGGFTRGSGSSYASPQVAGVAALLREIDPSLSPDGVRETLRNSGRPIVDQRMRGDGTIVGREHRVLDPKSAAVRAHINANQQSRVYLPQIRK